MKILGKICASFYSIIFTICLFALILAFTVAGYLSGNFFTKLITSEALMNTKLSELDFEFDGREEITELCGEDCTIEEAIISVASDGYGISKNLIEEALEDKDVQEKVGEFISYFINASATNQAEKLDYKDYEKVLEKEVIQDIMKELNYTNEDIKKIIDEYNKYLDEYNGYTNGGFVSEQQSTIR